METINLSALTPEQKSKLRLELEAEELARQDKIKKDRETYKILIDETVSGLFKDLSKLSAIITDTKAKVFKSFESILNMKADVYGIRTNQQSHTFTTSDGLFTIKIGHRVIDNYDDTVNAGIAKVRNYIRTLAKDEDSQALVDTILNLLKQDKDGNLKASRVLELDKLANKIGDETFLDGIKIIKESYKQVKTCQFVSVSYKDEKGQEKVLPLSMSAAD